MDENNTVAIARTRLKQWRIEARSSRVIYYFRSIADAARWSIENDWHYRIAGDMTRMGPALELGEAEQIHV
jgi:hypothetical protein